ncbi:MAG TPA: bacillithiol system redox-active protein YtxJ [Dyadobacter sp.]|jgi:bacillithiol system protein YtxJ|nr:bacillithiol system redox-active protein YtxJ [Dyadobacter sp.]
MNWITITSEEQIQAIKSEEKAIIYKHSPRCMTSLMAYRQLKSEVNGQADLDLPIYIVDVISNRRESQYIASTFDVEHQSPQILVVKDGQSIFDTSHERVSLMTALSHLS